MPQNRRLPSRGAGGHEPGAYQGDLQETLNPRFKESSPRHLGKPTLPPFSWWGGKSRGKMLCQRKVNCDFDFAERWATSQ